MYWRIWILLPVSGCEETGLGKITVSISGVVCSKASVTNYETTIQFIWGCLKGAIRNNQKLAEVYTLMEDLRVTSKSFQNGGLILQRHSAYGENKSPELTIHGIDELAVSMAITLDDASHPLFPNYNHWIAWNLAPANVIPEGLPKGRTVEQPIHLEQGIAYGRHCYRGPKPPFNWSHEYIFTVYILDVTLAVSTDSNKKTVLAAMEGHVIQKGVLKGTYQRRSGAI